MIRKVYKVVELNGGWLRSVMFFRLPYGWSLRYKIGVWTKGRDGSYVFAFNDLLAAKRFANPMPYTEIWEAKADVVMRNGRPELLKSARRATCWHTRSFSTFWAFFKRKIKTTRVEMSGSPFGTVYCRKIKLIRKVG